MEVLRVFRDILKVFEGSGDYLVGRLGSWRWGEVRFWVGWI